MAHAVELGGERNEAELLEDQRDRRAESDAEERPGDAHAAPRGAEHLFHGLRRRSENREHRGVPRARRSEDGRRRCQVQARDDHDQKDGREEDEALEPQSEDQRAVLLLPRGHRDGGTERRRYRRGGVLRPHRVLQEHLVTGRPIGAEREEAPRLVERQARLGRAPSRRRGREARNLHRRDDRDGSEGRQPRARRDERHGLPRHDAERPGLRDVEDEALRLLAAHDLGRSGVAPHRNPDTAPRDRRDGHDAGDGGEPAAHAIHIVKDASSGGRYEEVRRLGEKPALHVRLKPREQRE